ncbi:divergent polysaccharide deacetylase family protein [Hyphococcus sp.]|uniref:divergent polysaccharide deacetylase family protein n=1 Tax=Hyphococcus sp. TaxID=2038636 RepID=UPI00207FF16B|nr:MAG: hypothetical protein DHS20C04_28700 [Marinicaulis sp.]
MLRAAIRDRRVRYPGERPNNHAGNAGLIATVAIAFAGVFVGAVSAYLGERGVSASAMTAPEILSEAKPEDAARAHRDRIVERIISGQAPERLTPPPDIPHAYVSPPLIRRPKVVIILDDMGIDRRNSERAISLPGPLTFSFLPYANKAAPLAAEAQKSGGEIMLHLPMEPDGAADPGPHALKTGMTGADFLRNLEWNLDRFDGYVGVNNHMGSKLTADIAAMKTLIAYLDDKGVFFVDSVTTPQSAAREAAREIGVDIYARDVFLDAEAGSEEVVKAQLAVAERIAQETGYVVAIGHPRTETLNVLGPWLTTAPARGFDLVFASALKTMQHETVKETAQPQQTAAAPTLRL